MKILTAVFLFLGILFVAAPSFADVPGSASSSFGGGSNVTPMNLTPPNITPGNITPMNLTPPNITPMSLSPPNVTPMSLSPQNITPANITPMNLPPPNITPMNLPPPAIIPATSVNPAHIQHFQAALAAQQQAQQNAWEAQMIDRQKQLDQARMAAEAESAAAAAKIAPASGNTVMAPAPYKPSIFLVGIVKLVNTFAADRKGNMATAP